MLLLYTTIQWSNMLVEQIAKWNRFIKNKWNWYFYSSFIQLCFTKNNFSYSPWAPAKQKKIMIWQFYQIYTLWRRYSRSQLICYLWILFLRQMFNMIWKLFSIKNENLYYKKDRKHKMYLIDNLFCFYF